MRDENKRKRKKERVDELHGSNKQDQIKQEPQSAVQEDIVEGLPGRKHRKRLKGQYKRLAEQLEFYFSDANLRKDGFMWNLVKKDPWVPLTTFDKFNKIKSLMAELNEGSVQHHLVKALEVKKSTVLLLSDDSTKVKRLHALQEDNKDTEECTVYVENIAPDTSHEMLKTRFQQFGKVAYVSIPKFRKSQKAKGFAFIEFDSVDGVKSVLEACGVKADEILLPDPASLLSIKTFSQQEEEHNDSKENENISDAKRKIENEDDDFDAPKRLRIDENEKKYDTSCETSCDTPCDTLRDNPALDNGQKADTELLALHGFRILTKTQWRRLRNQYLNQQRQNVSAAKTYLKTHAAMLESRPTNTSNSNTAPEPKYAAPEAADSVAAVKVEVEVNSLEFTSGLIVKIFVPGGIDDVKVVKKRVREEEDISYVDATIGAPHFYVRCRNADQTHRLVGATLEDWRMLKLEGDEEMAYWDKIRQDMNDKKSGRVNVPKMKNKKKKLLNKMDQIRNSHVHFGDA